MENIEGRTGGTFNKQKGKIFRNAEDIEIIPSVNIDDITNGILISNDLNTSENKNNTNAPKTIQEIQHNQKIELLKETLNNSNNIDVSNLNIKTDKDLSKLPTNITGLETTSDSSIIDEYYPSDEDANTKEENNSPKNRLSKLADNVEDIYMNNQSTKYTHLLTSKIDDTLGTSTLFNNAKLKYIHTINKDKDNEIFFDEQKQKYFYTKPQQKKNIKSLNEQNNVEKIDNNINNEEKKEEVTSEARKLLQFYEYNISDKLTPNQLKALNSCEIDITGNFLKGNSITSWFDAIQQEGLNTAKLFTKDGNQIYLKDIVKLDELYTFTGIKNFKEIKNMLKTMSSTDQLINITNEALNTANLGGVSKLIEGNTEEGITAINNTLTEVKKIVFSSVTEFVFHNIQHMMATFEDLCKQLINEMPTKITGYTLEKYTKELNTVDLNKIIDDLKKNTKEALEQSIQTELNNLGATKVGSLVGSFNTTMENINSFALSGISKINSIIDQIPEGTKWVDTQVNKNMENVYAAIGEKLFNSYEYLRNQRDLLAKQVGDRIGEYKARKANEKIEKNAIKTLQQAQKIKTMASSFAESQKHVLKMWLNRIIKL